MKFRNLKNKDTLLSISAILIFVAVVAAIPVYDEINGLHNTFFDTYNIVWSDGRSPINFYLIKNIISGNGISFPGNFTFGTTTAADNYDFFEYKGLYYPAFALNPVYLFSIILKPFDHATDLVLYKMIALIVVAFYAGTLFVFFYVQRILGLKNITAFFSTTIAGLATSIFIYSHYFFLTEPVTVFFFFVFLLSVLKFWNKNSRTASYILPVTLFLFIFFLVTWRPFFLLMLAITFFFTYFRNKTFDSWKIFAVIMFVLYVINWYFFAFSGPQSVFDGLTYVSIFRIFPTYLNANDFNLYGFHSTSLSSRYFAYFYGIAEGKANAIFVHSIGPLGALFSEKGFVYNSIFLVFSIFGIFLYKDREKRNFILVLLISLLLLFSLRWEWYGGVTPRYVRSFEIPILLLTFFAFYFLQENKNKLVLALFVLLVAVSLLNVASLAVRTDWTYEKSSDLFSYDLVLWPFIPNQPSYVFPSSSNLLNKTEIGNWILDGDSGCKAVLENGIRTDSCYCDFNSWAVRTFKEPWQSIQINATVCANEAGNDGTIGSIYLNDKSLDSIFVPSYNCTTKSYMQNITPGNLTIRLQSGKYGNCEGEMVFWKYLSIEKG